MGHRLVLWQFMSIMWWDRIQLPHSPWGRYVLLWYQTQYVKRRHITMECHLWLPSPHRIFRRLRNPGTGSVRKSHLPWNKRDLYYRSSWLRQRILSWRFYVRHSFLYRKFTQNTGRIRWTDPFKYRDWIRITKPCRWVSPRFCQNLGKGIWFCPWFQPFRRPDGSIWKGILETFRGKRRISCIFWSIP